MKECVKGVLGRHGNRKYAMHGDNRLLRLVKLRDGRRVFEFLRCNPYWGGVQHAATGDGLAEALAPRVVEQLIQRGGVCVLYTHLGKIRDPREPIGRQARDALRNVAERFHSGQLLVTTTRRLLGLCRAVREVEWSASFIGGKICIDLRLPSADRDGRPPLTEADLEGLTIYVPDAHGTCVLLNGREVTGISRNAPDESGRASASLAWRRLEFPDL
jgi:hypothetical protein